LYKFAERDNLTGPIQEYTGLSVAYVNMIYIKPLQLNSSPIVLNHVKWWHIMLCCLRPLTLYDSGAFWVKTPTVASRACSHNPNLVLLLTFFQNFQNLN